MFFGQAYLPHISNSSCLTQHLSAVFLPQAQVKHYCNERKQLKFAFNHAKNQVSPIKFSYYLQRQKFATNQTYPIIKLFNKDLILRQQKLLLHLKFQKWPKGVFIFLAPSMTSSHSTFKALNQRQKTKIKTEEDSKYQCSFS